MQQKLFYAFVLVVALSLIGSLSASAQGSGPQASSLGNTITFQGHLKDGSTPGEGNYDFQFKLFDSSSGGSQWGSTLEKGDIPVSVGVFTVQLDFGAAYRGQALWLEVGVRTGNSTGAYTVLSPRQELTAAPYANYSLRVPWSGLDGNPPLDILQARVSQACGAGSSIRAIGADGAVTCETDDGQAYTAGPGLTLSSGQFSVNFAGSGSSTMAARSDHNHLGQTWTGSNNALTIGGSFGSPSYAPLSLSNSTYNGLRITSAGLDGIEIVSAGRHGVKVDSVLGSALRVESAQQYGVVVNSAGIHGLAVDSAGSDGLHVLSANTSGVFVGSAARGLMIDSASQDGVLVSSAGTPTTTIASDQNNGLEVAGAQGNGLYVGRADKAGAYVGSAVEGFHVGTATADGVYVGYAGAPSTFNMSSQSNGFEVDGAQGYGLYVGRAELDGVYVQSAYWHGLNVADARVNGVYVTGAGNNGINVHGANLAGYFDGAIQVTGGCTGCVISAFGVNASGEPLEPGDVVTILGVQSSESDSTSVLWNVAPAAAGQAVVGVVQGKAEMVTEEVKRENETGKTLVPRAGSAAPGEYVTIIIYGPTQVKTSGAVGVGMRLAAGDLGAARILKTTEVNGIQVAESAPTIGIALDAPGENGLTWVLVNPQ